MTVDLTGITQAARATSPNDASRPPLPQTDAMAPHELAQASPVQAAIPAAALGPPSTPATGTLQFNLDPQTSQVIVQIVDGDTTEIIQKFPAESALAFAKTIDATSGLFIKTQA